MRAMSLQGVDDVRQNGLSTRQGTTADKRASSMKVMSEIQAAWHGMSSGAWGYSAIPGGSLSSANTSPPGCFNWITQPAKTAAHGCDRATEKGCSAVRLADDTESVAEATESSTRWPIPIVARRKKNKARCTFTGLRPRNFGTVNTLYCSLFDLTLQYNPRRV